MSSLHWLTSRTASSSRSRLCSSETSLRRTWPTMSSSRARVVSKVDRSSLIDALLQSAGGHDVGQPAQDAVDELRGVVGAVDLGHLDGLVDGHRVGDVLVAVEHLPRSQPQDVAVDDGHAGHHPVLGDVLDDRVYSLQVRLDADDRLTAVLGRLAVLDREGAVGKDADSTLLRELALVEDVKRLVSGPASFEHECAAGPTPRGTGLRR